MSCRKKMQETIDENLNLIKVLKRYVGEYQANTIIRLIDARIQLHNSTTEKTEGDKK